MGAITERWEVRVSVVYGSVAMLWIIFSDTLIGWLLATNQPLLASIGTLKGLGFVGITTLALFAVMSTERRKRQQVEQALRESNHRFETLFRNSPDAIFLMNFATLTIVDCNEAACQMNGYARDELIGQSINMLNVTPNPEELSQRLQERLRLEGVLHLQQEHRRKDGSTFTIDNSVCHLSISGQDLIVGIDRDITERKRAEETLAEERNLLRTLIDNLPDNIFVKDKAGRIITDNVAHRNLLRVATPDEVVGKTDFDFFSPDLAATYFADEQSIIASGLSLIDREEPTINPDGSTHWLLTTKVPLSNSLGQVIGLVGINRDITERKRLEEERMVAERLKMELEKEKELSELKGRFISMVSHEYRTPLAVILSSTDILSSYADRLPLERKQKLLDDIRSQVNYMVRLLDDVLTVSQAQIGKLTFSPICVDVETYCQRIFESVQLADHGAHRFTLVQNTEPVGIAKVDDHLLQQILTNLLSNAAKYSPHGTEVCLELARETRHLVFRVRDQGLGIPAADQARLFEPFHRAKNVGTTQGTGLGLSIVKYIVDALGGTITFTSGLETGTTFTVRLPLSAEDVNGSLSL